MDSYKQYKIDYENGNIPVGELSIGSRVTDPSWEWEFRTGNNYSKEQLHQSGGGHNYGKVKPVTWIVVAKDHYSDLAPHVTLLSEELIGKFCFDVRKKKTMFIFVNGHLWWSLSGDSEAAIGLRTWLNSTGIHSEVGFYASFSESFKDIVLTTNVSCRDVQDEEHTTQDKVFIPSAKELGNTLDPFIGHYDYGPEVIRRNAVGKAFKYFKKAKDGDADEHNTDYGVATKRVAKLAGYDWWYWTRTVGELINVHVVTKKGEIGSEGPVSGWGGVRPVLNIKSETLLSEA